MQIKQHLERLTKCHNLAYSRLYDAIDNLNDKDYFSDQGLFFDSIHGTLNHMALVDLLWFYRLRNEKIPFDVSGLDQIIYTDRAELKNEILHNSNALSHFVSAQPEEYFEQTLRVKTLSGSEIFQQAYWLVATVTNHGTHHRGQITTCLNKMNINYQTMDLPFFPEI